MNDANYVLIYTGSYRDPRLTGLDDHAGVDWYILVLLAARHGQVIPFDAAIDQFTKFKHYDAGRTGRVLKDLERAELVVLHANGDIELLARGDLWALGEDMEDE